MGCHPCCSKSEAHETSPIRVSPDLRVPARARASDDNRPRRDSRLAHRSRIRTVALISKRPFDSEGKREAVGPSGRSPIGNAWQLVIVAGAPSDPR